MSTIENIFIGPLTAYNIQTMVEMGIVLAGSEEDFRNRPFFMIGTCPVSPLRLTVDFCEMIMEGARQGLPIMILSI